MVEIEAPLSAQELARSLLRFKDEDEFFSSATINYFSAVLYWYRRYKLPHILSYVMTQSIENEASDQSQTANP